MKDVTAGQLLALVHHVAADDTLMLTRLQLLVMAVEVAEVMAVEVAEVVIEVSVVEVVGCLGGRWGGMRCVWWGVWGPAGGCGMVGKWGSGAVT